MWSTTQRSTGKLRSTHRHGAMRAGPRPVAPRERSAAEAPRFHRTGALYRTRTLLRRKDTTMSTPEPSQTHSLVANIDQYLSDGLAVFDVNGKRVGTVKMYSAAAG